MKGSLKLIGTSLRHYQESQRMIITKLILRKIKKMKTVWKTIKEIINVKKSNDVPINSLLIGETITTNAKLIANYFNTFFTSVAAKLNEKIVKAKKPFSHYLGQTTDETIFLSPTNPAEVESLINCIKSDKAIGPNSILTKY